MSATHLRTRFAELSALRTSKTHADESRTRPTPNVSCEIPEKTPGNGTGKPTRARPQQTDTRGLAPRESAATAQATQKRRNDHEGPSTEHHKHTHTHPHKHTHKRLETPAKTPARETRESPQQGTKETPTRTEDDEVKPTRGVVSHGWSRTSSGVQTRRGIDCSAAAIIGGMTFGNGRLDHSGNV